MDPSSLESLLEMAREAARAAGALLAGAQAHDVRTKSNPRDLVTEWDLRSEAAIRDVLARRAPNIPVLAEEEGERGGAGASDYRWLVDPIDGTVNFSHGLPIWSISIALEDVATHRPVVGVVSAPALGWWFEAALGQGAHDGAGARLAVSARAPLDQAMLSTGFPYDMATHPVNNFAEWEHLQRVAGACRRLGSASIDLCLVGCGWIDGYWERRLSPWDLAAGALIVAEAGGTVTSTRGEAFDPHSGEVAATNGAIHTELLAELARVRAPG